MSEPRIKAASLRVRIHRIADTTTVRLFGELDLASREVLHRTLDGLEPWGLGLCVLDLAEVDFLDAAGLRGILDARERLGDDVVIHAGRPHVQRLFSITGLDHQHTLAGQRGGVPGGLRFDSNCDLVLRLWRAFQEAGPQAMANLVPADVVWQPWHNDGRELRGSASFCDFWKRQPAPQGLRLVSCAPSDDDVIVRSDVPLPGGGVRPLWSLYEFSGGRLLRAVTLRAVAASAHDRRASS